jgi:hypothetical protein
VKLIRREGKQLECFELGPVVYRLSAVNGPIKLHRVLEDVAARELLLKLAAAQGSAPSINSRRFFAAHIPHFACFAHCLMVVIQRNSMKKAAL